MPAGCMRGWARRRRCRLQVKGRLFSLLMRCWVVGVWSSCGSASGWCTRSGLRCRPSQNLSTCLCAGRVSIYVHIHVYFVCIIYIPVSFFMYMCAYTDIHIFVRTYTYTYKCIQAQSHLCVKIHMRMRTLA